VARRCVITKPRGRGGHSPRWAAVSEMMMMMMVVVVMIMIMIIIIIIIIMATELFYPMQVFLLRVCARGKSVFRKHLGQGTRHRARAHTHTHTHTKPRSQSEA
jgi:hypothetical protein